MTDEKTLARRGVIIYGSFFLIFFGLYSFMTLMILCDKKTSRLVEGICVLALWASTFRMFKALAKTVRTDWQTLRKRSE